MDFSNSYTLLNEARNSLTDVSNIYAISLKNKKIPPVFSLKIKKFLDEVRSSLDFIAYEIFLDFCKDQIPDNKIERISKRLYFPIRTDLNSFDKYVTSHFVGLSENKPEIIELIESIQPFETKPKTFYYLNELSNENKHRDFSVKQFKNSRQTIINTENGGQFIFQDSFVESGSFEINNQILVMDDNQNLVNKDEFSSVKNLRWETIEFKTLNIEVLITLITIYNTTVEFFRKLEETLED